MREGSLSPESWRLLQSRVLVEKDARLQAPPFSTNPVYYTCHRHSIRTALSYALSAETAAKHEEPFFILPAADSVPSTMQSAFTDEAKEELLLTTTPRPTKRSPGYSATRSVQNCIW